MKHLLGIKELSAQDIKYILDRADDMKKNVLEGGKKASHLSGKSIITLFYENSTRTRLSFELASKYLGATAANITASGSSVAKGETLPDTGKTIDAMGADVIIIRHSSSGAPHLLSKYTKAAIVNAGDGMNEHPTQALLDFMTMREKFGSFEGLKVAIVGDVKHSRVARSDVYGLKKLGAEVTLCAPPTLMPVEMESFGVRVTEDADEAVKGADVVMGLRIQLERQKSGLFPSVREYHKMFGINERRMALANPNAIIMHPGPVNRGVELAASMADGPQSVINEQVTNGVCVRMAVLDILS
ncbi:MAG: aspartate carbamoyltransferase catalytic subunit, partial [Clostridia bacterium]|nr:aspartate carbamoyltransferase catalytic subunit [Clostridia bacterium]